MAKFQLHIVDKDLNSETVWDLIGSSTCYIEWLERTKAKMPQSLSDFLSLDIYMGRSRNAGHKAFWHPNYRFPAFADEVLNAVKAIKADEYVKVIDELKAVMGSDIVQKSSNDYYDLKELEELGLDDVFKDFDDRSYNIRLTRIELEERISCYSRETMSWVLDRYDPDKSEEPYFHLAAAWLMDSFEIVTHSEEGWKDILSSRSNEKLTKPSKKTPLSFLQHVFRRR